MMNIIFILPMVVMAVTQFQSALAVSCKRAGNNLERCFYASAAEASAYCNSYLAAPTPTVAGFKCATKKNNALYAPTSIASVCSCLVTPTSSAVAAPTSTLSTEATSTITSSVQVSQIAPPYDCSTSISEITSTSYVTFFPSSSECPTAVSVSTSYVTVSVSTEISFSYLTMSASTLTVTESCALATSSTIAAPVASSSVPVEPAQPPAPYFAAALVTLHGATGCNSPTSDFPTRLVDQVCHPEGGIASVSVDSFAPGGPDTGPNCGASIRNCFIQAYANADCTSEMSRMEVLGRISCLNNEHAKSYMLYCTCQV